MSLSFELVSIPEYAVGGTNVIIEFNLISSGLDSSIPNFRVQFYNEYALSHLIAERYYYIPRDGSVSGIVEIVMPLHTLPLRIVGIDSDDVEYFEYMEEIRLGEEPIIEPEREVTEYDLNSYLLIAGIGIIGISIMYLLSKKQITVREINEKRVVFENLPKKDVEALLKAKDILR